MRVVDSVAALRDALAGHAFPLGLVPTMGALHAGHRSLLQAARTECGTVVMSLFVNPAQFGPHEDLARYPRPFERDRALAEEAGVDLLFAPPVEEMYPPGWATWVEVDGLGEHWEGAHRQGHFRGVATVVLRLLLAVAPDRAYFGEKDYQQLQIIRRVVTDLLPWITIVGCPTVREPDGLALSSRNVYLPPAERAQATALYRALLVAQERATAGEREGARLEAAMRAELEYAPGLAIDYTAVVDPATLEPLARLEREARALVAARLGAVRLIDNADLRPPL
jgi:pantoate--beta-alanine ligase